MRTRYEREKDENVRGKNNTNKRPKEEEEGEDDNNGGKQKKAEEEEEEEWNNNRRIVELSVGFGFVVFGGFSLCLKALYIPGLFPFLGGIVCGVSLIDPPPLDKLLLLGTSISRRNRRRFTDSQGQRRRRRYHDRTYPPEEDTTTPGVRQRPLSGEANKIIKYVFKSLFR